ncbi:hypothetical protein GKJPGBOP_07090 [Streptomyces paromomycinus]|uniref:Uncharacterized protein n=1 Tax=Streptomyces paromomycinus TaxID=92743 RepID=A0A401WD95_STREY|nr:hypothetical protein GKJPGBOP_07090 [Streptomyces paromomycinus]
MDSCPKGCCCTRCSWEGFFRKARWFSPLYAVVKFLRETFQHFH